MLPEGSVRGADNHYEPYDIYTIDISAEHLPFTNNTSFITASACHGQHTESFLGGGDELCVA